MMWFKKIDWLVDKLIKLSLGVATLLCVLNIAIIWIVESPKYLDFVTGLPFNIFKVGIAIFIYRIVSDLVISKKDEDLEFIKKNYPDIWSQLHPLGKFSASNIVTTRFIMGRYDDGMDMKLNEIKRKWRLNAIVDLWPFLLVLIAFSVKMIVHLAIQ